MTAKKTAKRLTLAEIKAELAEIARIGQVFVDGDLCRKAYQPYAETFMTGDDMDFNPAAAVPLKQTLLRLERVSRVPCSTALWRRRPDAPSSGEALLYGTTSSPQAGGKPGNRGYVPPKMTRELAAAFLEGKSVTKVNRKAVGSARVMYDRGQAAPAKGIKGPCVVQRFAPITDSMGEIAAVLEVFAAAVDG